MTHRQLPDDELDRLLREALADDLPVELEADLRSEARRAFFRAATRPRWARWPIPSGLAAAWRPALPQPALVAIALAMLAAGAVMQAAPPPSEVVESLREHQARVRSALALDGAAAMECTVEVDDGVGRRLSYRVTWRAPGDARVRLDGPAGRSERRLRVPEGGESVLARAVARDDAPSDPALEPVRACLSPAALGERLAAPWRPAPADVGAVPGAEVFFVGPRTGPTRLRVVIDGATRLPVRLDAVAGNGRTQTVSCRWP